MSGRRQHYLPQLLQRPFSHRTKGDLHYVHTHEKLKSFAPNTAGIGLERDFYGHPDLSPADANITQGETPLADIVDRLNRDGLSSVSANECALLIGSLAVRTKAMRNAMSDISKALVSAAAEAFQHQNFLRRELTNFWDDTRQIDRLIDEQTRKTLSHANREQRARARMLVKAKFSAEKEQQIEQLVAQGRALAASILEQLDEKSAEVANNAFIRVFEQDPGVPKRVATLETYSYCLADADPGDEFILGDCAAVAIRADGEPRLAVGDFDDAAPLDQIFLPISPKRCLVGSRTGTGTGVMPPTAQINRLSASLSSRFVLSFSAKPKDLESLRSLIGTAAPIASDTEFQTMIASLNTW